MKFQQSPSGYRNVFGTVVEELQTSLNRLGFDAGTVDGVWGGSTLRALGSWHQQQQQAKFDAGVVDDEVWGTLTGQDVPELWRRALQLTAAWEGTGYGGSNGNFDGAGITWGVVGFTWRNGELQGILEEIREKFPVIFSACFGPLEAEIVSVLGQSREDQMRWAQRISFHNGEEISPRWASAFGALGEHLEVRQIEDQHAHDRYWAAAERMIDAFDLETDAGRALAFDIVVQITVSSAAIAEMKQKMGRGMSELERMRVIATVIADHAADRWHDDVLLRKMTFVSGRGVVHGDRYDITCWGIG